MLGAILPLLLLASGGDLLAPEEVSLRSRHHGHSKHSHHDSHVAQKTDFVDSEGSNSTTGGAQGGLNVLFMVVDDLRYQLGFQGPGVKVMKEPRMHTPHIDALASKSAFFSKAYVSQALCSPARTSVLTGRRPEVHRVYDLKTYFRDSGGDFTTLPGHFKKEGYVTMNIGKIFHENLRIADDGDHSWSLAPYHPHSSVSSEADKSWEAIPPEEEKAHPLPDTQAANLASLVLEVMDGKRGEGGKPKSACDFVDRFRGTEMLVQMCKEQGVAQPHRFFMAVGFKRPHLPFVAPQRFFDMYKDVPVPSYQTPPKRMPSVAWSPSGELFTFADIHAEKKTLVPGDTLAASTTIALRRAYMASVSHVDEEVGHVMDTLASTSFESNTMTVFFGDHGYHLGELGMWTKHTNFDLANHAPLMFRVPGRTEHGFEDLSYVEHIDIFPTVAELALGKKVESCPSGKAIVKASLCVQGKSLAPQVLGTSKGSHSTAFSQYPRAFGEWTGSPPGGTWDDGSGSLWRNSTSLLAPLAGEDETVSECLTGKCVMGFSVVTNLKGTEYRYTEWVHYENHKPDWNKLYGVELYDHGEGEEINNQHGGGHLAAIEKDLQAILKQGPLTGGGWGPWH